MGNVVVQKKEKPFQEERRSRQTRRQVAQDDFIMEGGHGNEHGQYMREEGSTLWDDDDVGWDVQAW